MADGLQTTLQARAEAASWTGAVLRLLPPVEQLGFQLVADRFAAAAAELGIPALPGPNRFVTARGSEASGGGGGVEIIWLGPTEFLAVGVGEGDEDRLRVALGDGGSVVDLTAARVPIELSGPAARTVLSTCAALDLHSRVFGPGSAAVTLVARVPVVLRQTDEAPSYRLLVPPSLVGFLVEWLLDGMESVRSDQ
jgi:sarcosine oxidase subunit gamma